jgi:nucleotide-binding universal stress UspA family protein
MSAIVCAIRGGPGSKPTIARAIELAQETGFGLHLLYVVNLDFMAHTGSSRVRRLSQDLHQMGEFILLTAMAQAETAGVAAECHVRHGSVIEEIEGLIRDLNAEYLVLGAPSQEPDERVFDRMRLQAFAEKVHADTGVEVVLADGGAA